MNSKKVLVIDDDRAILESLELLLDFEGFEVEVKEKGSEVFSLPEEVFPDLILLDMWLSGEDGRDICKKLKAHEATKKTPVIMMSASRGLEHTALEAGANAFIAKPFDIDDILDKVNSFIA